MAALILRKLYNNKFLEFLSVACICDSNVHTLRTQRNPCWTWNPSLPSHHCWASWPDLHTLLSLGFPGGLAIKNPLAMQETCVQSLGREEPLEKEMTAYSSVLAWEIPWAEEHGRLQSIGSQRLGQNWKDSAHTHAWHPLSLQSGFCSMIAFRILRPLGSQIPNP